MGETMRIKIHVVRLIWRVDSQQMQPVCEIKISLLASFEINWIQAWKNCSHSRKKNNSKMYFQTVYAIASYVNYIKLDILFIFCKVIVINCKETVWCYHLNILNGNVDLTLNWKSSDSTKPYELSARSRRF